MSTPSSGADVTVEGSSVTMPTPNTNSTFAALSYPPSMKRRRATVSDDNLEDQAAQPFRKSQKEEERASKRSRSGNVHDNTEAGVSDPTPDHGTYRIRDTADVFLATELRRRKERGFAPLSDSEKTAFLNNARQTIEKIGTGSSFEHIKDDTKMLRMLTQDAKVEADHDLYTAALFTVHYGRIRTELDALDAFMQSRTRIHPEDLKALKGSIDRLHLYLDRDKVWRHITAHLNFRIDTLRTIRDKLRSAETLQHRTILIAKIDCIERLLTPPEDGDDEATIRTGPLEDALQQNQEMQKNITETEAHHKQELIKKDRELVNMNLRLKHALSNTEGKNQDSYAMEHLKSEIVHEKKARLTVEKLLKDEIAALNTKHKKQVEDLAIIYEKKFEHTWRARREDEKRKIEDEAAKLRDIEKSLFETKIARRNELLARAKQRNMGIQHLLNRQQDGTLALTKETEIPSKQECLDGLTDLWKSKGALISQVLPHELMIDHDFALEFEVEIMVTARVFMLALQLWSFGTQELLETHWSLTAIHRLKCGLIPYHSDNPLATLSIAVCDIHRVLEQAVADTTANQMTVINCGQPVASFAGSKNDANSWGRPLQPLSIQQPPSILVSQPTPPAPSVFMDTWQNEDSALPMEHESTNTYQGYVPNTVYHPQDASSFAFPPLPLQQGREKRKDICHNMAKKGTCSFGDRCKFSHDIASVQDAHGPELQAPNVTGAVQDMSMIDHQGMAMKKGICHNMAKKGSCSFGDRCKFSHDIAPIQAISHPNPTTQDIEMTDLPPNPRVDKRSATLCYAM